MSSQQPEIIFENDDFVAVNKPSGMTTIPAAGNSNASVKQLLKEKFGNIFTVHRLDQETSGVVIFAKNPAAHRVLSQEFENRQVQKIYLGIVGGILPEKKSLIDLPIAQHPSKRNLMEVNQKGKEALTTFEVLEEFRSFSLLKLQIHTGRTHQIRVHLASIGFPILCDPLYGNDSGIYISSIKRNYKLSKVDEVEKPVLARLGLHASTLQLQDLTGQQQSIEAPLPKDMRALIQQLRKWNRGG